MIESNFDNIECFIKFGKKEHLKQILKGKLWFSPGLVFQNIENKQLNKGRGDKNEGIDIIHPIYSKMILTDRYGKSIEQEVKIETCNLKCQGIDEIPIFSLSCIYKNQLFQKSKKIKRKEVSLNRIKRDFNPDSFLVIKNPISFLSNLYKNIYTPFCRSVFYQDINTLTVNEMNFNENANSDLKDNSNEIETSGMITDNNFYKKLYKKDNYFNHQQEYRITLPKERIKEAKYFYINEIKSDIYDIKDFFKVSIK